MICIISAVWDRWPLTEIFLKSLQRYWKDCGIPAVIAGSEGVKSREACLDHGAHYIEVKNRPLSNKFNKAAQTAMATLKPDYLLILGSDDFIDDSLIKNYSKYINEGYDVIGVKDCYFYNIPSNESAYWKGYSFPHRIGESIGMARLLSKKVYQRVGGKLWPSNMNSGLDYTMMQRLKRAEPLKRITLSIKDVGIAVDFKGVGNITEFGCYRANMKKVSEEIFNTIPEFSLIQKL